MIPLAFVSAFINLKEDRSKDKSPEKCFNHFRTLAASGIHIFLFMSPDYAEIAKGFEKDFPNVHLVELLELEDLDTYKQIKELNFKQLPERRTGFHDTMNFMILMNAKMEFIKRVHNKYNNINIQIENFAWIDFSICHIFKNPQATLKHLKILAKSNMKSRGLFFPGCYSYEISKEKIPNALKEVIWRFCGGFFFGDIHSIQLFYQLQMIMLNKIANESGVLPWEVNTWAITEHKNKEYLVEQNACNVYIADHNDTMITNIQLAEHITVEACLTTIPSRIPKLKATIDSLKHQVSKINIHLCKSYKRFPEYDETKLESLIKIYLETDDKNDTDNVEIRFVEDYGPATKYLGFDNTNYNSDNQWIFFCDDDQEYHPTLISRMVNQIKELGVYQNRYENVKTGSGGLIHGYVGNLVHSSLIKTLLDFPLSDTARFVDDQWMSIYYFLSNVNIFPTGIESYGDIFKTLRDGYELIGVDSLASIGNRDTKIRLLEEEYCVYFLKEGRMTYKDEVDNFDITKYIDKVFYINLEYRKDRRQEIESELNRFNIPYERFEAIATPEFGIVGCGYSHLGVLKLAKERGYRNVLIFEDDFMFITSKAEFVYNIKQLFESSPEPFDICMLSYNLLNSVPMLHKPYLIKALDVQTASGYIVNNTMYDRLIELYEWAFPLLKQTQQHWIYANDQIWKRFQPGTNWFCFRERLGKQRPSYSDNGQSWADLGC